MDDRKGYYALFDETDWTSAQFPASKYLVAQTSTYNVPMQANINAIFDSSGCKLDITTGQRNRTMEDKLLKKSL
jgi:hypothetical protein